MRFCKTAIARHRSAAEQQEQMPGEQKAPVAVLFRSKSHMPEYQAALEQAGLTTFVVGYSALLERPEIRDLMALLHVAADHTDTGSLMRLLATPRFTMSAADLTMLARFAEEQNTEQRFQALVQAGLAQPDTPANEWAAVVREYRDQVANAVFLPDVLLRGDLVKLLERLSAHGRNAITRAAVMLRQVHDAVGRPLGDVIRAGIEALDLDIDTVLAGVLHNPQHRANPALAHMPMDAIVDLVDTYTQEIAAEQTPSLHGFITWVDHLASVEDEAASLPDAPVDVELMTVHQSKGLEWDAVAVVGLTAVGFPSNQATISRSCWTSTIREAPSKVTGPHPNIMRPPTPGSPTPPPYPCLCVPMPAFCRDSPMIPMWKPTPSHRWRLWMMWSLLMMKCSAPCANSAMAWKKWMHPAGI